MSLARDIIKMCESIINEEKYLIMDKENDTTISGDTETQKIAVRSSDNNQISKDELRRTIDDAQDVLNLEDTEEISNDLEKNAEKLK